MFRSPLFVQGIGFLGVIAFIVSYQIRSNRALFFCQLVGLALFTAQFALLGALSGCLSLAVSILRNAMMMKYADWKWVRWKGWPALLSCLFLAILWKTWAGPVSLLAAVASISSTFVCWSNNARSIRLVNLVCASPCWLAYDAIVHSWGGLVNEAITLVSIVVSIARFGWSALGEDPSFSR
ncbi:MAG: YgjV family protein [Clostridiales bacterium]|nr:YgjV family protein [Clostridiales bacterium]